MSQNLFFHPSNHFLVTQSPTGPYYPSSFYYQGFEDDIFLLIKLSHVALIVFIIFAIVTMIYLLTSCCVSFTRRREKDASGVLSIQLHKGNFQTHIWKKNSFYLFLRSSLTVRSMGQTNDAVEIMIMNIALANA